MSKWFCQTLRYRYIKLFVHNRFSKWEEGCKCVRNPCEWALYFCKSPTMRQTPSINKPQARSHGTTRVSPNKAFSQVERGGCYAHIFHSLCLVYMMNKFHVPFSFSFIQKVPRPMYGRSKRWSTQHYFQFGCHGPFASSDVHTILRVPFIILCLGLSPTKTKDYIYIYRYPFQCHIPFLHPI